MFKGEAGDLDACGEVGRTLNFGAVHAVKEFAELGGEGDEDFGAFAAHRHETDRGFRVGFGLGRED